ncbi:MAG TPA: chemoreceptor glutamine deamidase CheD [Gammaproteobacteria bacterium]
MTARTPGPGRSTYYDARLGRRVHTLAPGCFHVATADELISTLLGSCVAACIYDPLRAIGGMNHFLLPDGGPGDRDGAPISSSNRYGVFAMESLINALLARGASKARLKVKLFGGGRILSRLSDVGARNIEFVRRFVETERLPIEAEDLGGEQARRVLMFPATGRVRVRKLPMLGTRDIGLEETRYLESVAPPKGSVELF